MGKGAIDVWTILHTILMVLLWILAGLAGLLTLILLLLCISVGIRTTNRPGSMSAWLKIGWISIKLTPRKPLTEKQKAKKEAKKKRKAEKKALKRRRNRNEKPKKQKSRPEKTNKAKKADSPPASRRKHRIPMQSSAQFWRRSATMTMNTSS